MRGAGGTGEESRRSPGSVGPGAGVWGAIGEGGEGWVAGFAFCSRRCRALLSGCVSFLFAVSERGVLFGSVRVQTRSECDDAGTPEA